MAMARSLIQFQIQGLKELERALRELPKATAKSAVRRALKRAGQPVADDASGRAPRDKGRLAESIVVKTTLTKRQRRRREKNAIEMFIGSTDRKAHLLEFGTEKMGAQPFLRPAWDAGKMQVLASIKTFVWEAIQKAAKRLARKAAKAGRA